MEGTYYSIDNIRYLVIDEVYILSGHNELLKSKDDRLINLSNIVKKSVNFNENYCIYVSQFFVVNKKSLEELYEKIKFDKKIQEIIFYPKIYGRKIYTYTILSFDLVDNVVKLAQFFMQKTKNQDVYNLLSLETKNKIGIAYIPTMEISKMCKQWFKETKKTMLLVKCRMDMVKKKWIPLNIIDTDEE